MCGREGHVGADCVLDAGAARGGGGAAELLLAVMQTPEDTICDDVLLLSTGLQSADGENFILGV